MIKALVKMLFFLGLGLLIAILVAPSFIDWNQHKADVMAHISPYFKRKVDVAGNMSLHILPQPEILLESVSIEGPNGAKAPVMSLKSLEVLVKLEPLLEGRIEVEKINLSNPVLDFTVYGNGSTSLSDVLATDLGDAAGVIQLNQVTITDGTLRYASELTGLQKTFDHLNLSIKADTLRGPYQVAGDMQYQKSKVSLAADTGLFDQALSAPVHISFTPEQGLPAIKIAGDLSLQAGPDIEGELAITKGNLASLLDIPSLNALSFMHSDADLTGTLIFKGGQFALNDIKAKFGKGTLQGKIAVQCTPKAMPSVTADLDVNGLVMTDRASDTYMDLPGNFQGSLHVKGKNIVWEGHTLAGLDAALSFTDKEWVLKNLQASLPGETQIRLAGTVTPKTNSASYANVQIDTNDLGKMIDALAPDKSSIFAILGGQGAIKKLQLASHAEVSPAKISFYDIAATVEDKARITGVLNTDRVTLKPNVTAKLHFSDWNSASFPDAFAQALSKSDADLELTASNFTHDGQSIADLSFKGKTGREGLEITDLSGTLGSKDNFSLKGHAASLGPITGLDATYTLKAAETSALAQAFGLPPFKAANADLKGTLKGDAGHYAYTVEGAADTLDISGLLVSKPVFKLDTANPAAVKMILSDGTVWGGKLNAETAYAKAAQGWTAAMKGTLKQADLQKLLDQLGLKGAMAGPADVDFDLSSPDASAAHASGKVGVQSGSVTVSNFSTAGLGGTLQKLTAMPENLQQLVDTSIHKGGTTIYKDVHGRLTLADGKVTVEELGLANADDKMALTGTAEFPQGQYSLDGDLQLTRPVGFPVLKIKATEKTYKVEGGKALEDYVAKLLPPPPAPVQPDVPSAPVPGKAATSAPPKAPAPPADQQPIKDILKRLDDGVPATEAVPEPAPVPTPAPAAQPDTEEKRQPQESPPEDDTAPVPLTH